MGVAQEVGQDVGDLLRPGVCQFTLPATSCGRAWTAPYVADVFGGSWVPGVLVYCSLEGIVTHFSLQGCISKLDEKCWGEATEDVLDLFFFF